MSGYKTFGALSTLTSADVQDYWMKQTVMVFASESARDTALSADKREGMIAYLQDTNWTTYYNGAAWLIIGGRLGVTATGSTQSVANNTLQTASFDSATNVNGTFLTPTGSTFTVPTGRSGQYTVAAKANLTTATTGVLELQIAGDAYDFGFNTCSAPAATVGGIEIAAASTIVLALKQGVGSAQNCNFKLSLWYQGPNT
jgi:hypothetical protein